MLNTCMKHYNAVKVRKTLFFGQRGVVVVGRAGEGGSRTQATCCLFTRVSLCKNSLSGTHVSCALFIYVEMKYT